MRCSLLSCQDVELPTLIYSEIVSGEIFSKKKNWYLTFVGLEKAFDRVPRDVVWYGGL